MNSDHELLTIAELAQRLRVRPTTIRRLVRQGVIRPVILSDRIRRFDVADVIGELKGRGARISPPEEAAP